MINQTSPWRRSTAALLANPRWAAGVVLALVATLLAVETLGPGRFGSSSQNGFDRVVDAAKRAMAGADLLTMLNQRSPGERTAGELADTKAHARTGPRLVPHQRALAKVRAPQQYPDSFLGPLFGKSIDTPQALPAIAPILEQPLPNVLVPPAPPILTGGPAIIGGPGPGGPGGPPPVVTPPENPPVGTPPTPPVPAVPEPGSWALMLLGFGVTGLALRRRPRAAPRRVALLR